MIICTSSGKNKKPVWNSVVLGRNCFVVVSFLQNPKFSRVAVLMCAFLYVKDKVSSDMCIFSLAVHLFHVSRIEID